MADLATESNFQTIPVDQIAPSPHQARKIFDEEALKGLAESMRQEGLLQPITVRLKPGEPVNRLTGESADSPDHRVAESPAVYELISGERRLRAAKMIGWPAIDAKVIKTVSEGEAAAKGLIENLQREDLNAMEEAKGFEELNRLDPAYWTQEQIGKITGKGQTYVSESLGLLRLPDSVQAFIARAILSRSHGELLLRLSTSKQQLVLAKSIEKHSWSVRETERRVNAALKKSASGKSPKEKGDYDPLSNVWPALLTNKAIDAVGGWVVNYKNDHWNFSVSSQAAPAKEDLARWFRQMGEVLGA